MAPQHRCTGGIAELRDTERPIVDSGHDIIHHAIVGADRCSRVMCFASDSASRSSVTTEAMFDADGDVVQVGRTRGTVVATGVPFDIAEVHRWTLRDGRAVAAHFSIDTAAMMSALAAD
jgi:ketosteroid isomerase-like protein